MAEGSLGTSLVFRSGNEGESYESLRGPFNAEAKPLLADELGPIVEGVDLDSIGKGLLDLLELLQHRLPYGFFQLP